MPSRIEPVPKTDVCEHARNSFMEDRKTRGFEAHVREGFWNRVGEGRGQTSERRMLEMECGGRMECAGLSDPVRSHMSRLTPICELVNGRHHTVPVSWQRVPTSMPSHRDTVLRSKAFYSQSRTEILSQNHTTDAVRGCRGGISAHSSGNVAPPEEAWNEQASECSRTKHILIRYRMGDWR
jgi:hypothetical protein